MVKDNPGSVAKLQRLLRRTGWSGFAAIAATSIVVVIFLGSTTSGLASVLSQHFAAEFVDGEWIVGGAETYEAAASQLGEQVPNTGLWWWITYPFWAHEHHLTALLDEKPGKAFSMALPSQAEDPNLARIATTGESPDPALRAFVQWALLDALPAAMGLTTDYRNAGWQVFAKDEPAQLLDIGCGVGYASLTAMSLGARSTCVEGNPRLLARLRMSRALALDTHLPGTMALVEGVFDREPGISGLRLPVHGQLSSGIFSPVDIKQPLRQPPRDGACLAVNTPGEAENAGPGAYWCFEIDSFSGDDVLLAKDSPLATPRGQLGTALKQARLDADAAAKMKQSLRSRFHQRLGEPPQPSNLNLQLAPPVAVTIDADGMEELAIRGLHAAFEFGAVKVLRTRLAPALMRMAGQDAEEYLYELYQRDFVLVHHQGATAKRFESYKCEGGWSVPIVARSEVHGFLMTAFDTPLDDVDTAVVLAHTSLAEVLTPALMRALHGNDSPLTQLDCDVEPAAE